jgi:hypothetical protein
VPADPVTRSPLGPTSAGGWPTRSRALMKLPKTGPARITAGMAKMSPNSSVRPRFAFRLAIAASGPGCGGMNPCRTDRPASAGIPTRSTGCRLRRATSSTIGISRTTPISKNSGMPISAATPPMAHGSARGPTRPTMVLTTRSAPPDSVSRPPIIAPSAISNPTLPVVDPSPVVKLVTMSATATRATTPSTAAPRISAKKGCTLSTVISTTTVAIPSSAAMISSAWLLVCWTSAARTVTARTPHAEGAGRAPC